MEIIGDWMTWKMTTCVAGCKQSWPTSELTKDYICPDCYIRIEMEKKVNEDGNN